MNQPINEAEPQTASDMTQQEDLAATSRLPLALEAVIHRVGAFVNKIEDASTLDRSVPTSRLERILDGLFTIAFK